MITIPGPCWNGNAACLKSSDQGAAEGAPFIASHLIQTTGKAFDDFAGGGADNAAQIKRMLGI